MTEKASKNKMNDVDKLTVNTWGVYLVISILCLTIIGMLTHSTRNSVRIVKKYVPLVDAVKEIKLETTTAHLWFEEILSGDTHEDMATVWRHQEKAKWYAEAMLTGDTFAPLEDPGMRKRVQDILRLLADFKKITRQRHETSIISGSGTDIDQQYDALYLEFIKESDEVETALQDVIAQDLTHYKFTQIVLILITLVLFLSIGVAFWRFDKYRAHNIRAINLRNEALQQEMLERRQAQASLKESEQRYTRLVENAEDLIYRRSLPDGGFEFINPAAIELFGYSSDEFYNSPALAEEIIHPDWRLFLREKWTELIDGKTSNYEYQIIDKAGKTKWVHQRNVIVYDDQGRPTAVEAIVIDVTETKTIEEERLNLERHMQQTQKLESLGILAGGIAHDFNNILMVILGNADIALQDLSPHAPARNHVQEIETAARRATGLAKQMLAYSGKGKFVVKPINLNEFVSEMIHMLEVIISKKAVLKFNYADNLPVFNGDETQIRQIIMNLITNASEAIGDRSGVIAVSTGAMACNRNYLNTANLATTAGLAEPLAEGVYVFIEVADTGCGMTEEIQQKLFDPFFTTKFTGRGLGMAAVQGIVRGHKGAIKVYSEIGKGTTFKILFPVAEKTTSIQEPETISEPKEQWQGKGTVLVADDEEAVCAVSKLMLERIGFEVLTAADGREALSVFKKNIDKIVCVLLDLTMPHLHGDEVFREMRLLRPDIKVIISSGYNEQDTTQQFSGKGLAGFIQKPYSSKSLISKLKEALDPSN